MGEQMYRKLNNKLRLAGNFLQSPLLLLIRLYWGYQFLVAGFGKFLHFGDVVTNFQSLGIPFPFLMTALVASIEFLGGALLLIGLASRLAAIFLFVVLLGAFFTVEQAALTSLFSNFDPAPFFRAAPFLFAYAVVLVFCFGPGKLSLDYWLVRSKKDREMP
jgi:putative oxidoreductase